MEHIQRWSVVLLSLVVFGSLSLTGCTVVSHLSGTDAVNTVTTRAVGFSGHPTRIYVVSNLTLPGGLWGLYGISLDNAVEKRMIPAIERCGGQAVFDRVNAPESAWTYVPYAYDDENDPLYAQVNTQPLAGQLLTLLNQDDRKTRIGDFKADVVLTMDLIRWQNGWAVVQSRVWDLRTKMFVWKAYSSGNWGFPSMSADVWVTDLMRKLRDDGMVPACGDESTSASQAAGAATEHNDGSAPNGTAPSH